MKATLLLLSFLAVLLSVSAIEKTESSGILHAFDTSLLQTEMRATLGVAHSDVQVELQRWEPSEKMHMELLSQLRALQEPSLLEMGSSNIDIPLQLEVLKKKNVATYFGVIDVNGHKFRVIFDTGSTAFWVPASTCATERCKKHTRYPLPMNASFLAAQAQSSNATVSNNTLAMARFKDKMSYVESSSAATAGALVFAPAKLDLNYISGHVSGPVIYANVSVGNVVVPQQMVGLAERLDVKLLDDVKWDGILGLAYPNLSAKSTKITPLFDQLINNNILTSRGLVNQFAYYLGDRGGSITFGGANCALLGATGANCVDKFSFVPVTDKGYWTMALDNVHVQYPNGVIKSTKCPAQGCKAIVDTGTYLSYAPRGQFQEVMPTSVGYCGNIKDLPHLTFSVRVAPGWPAVTLTLTPDEYVLRHKVGAREDCLLGFVPDQSQTWTLGQVFLKKFYTIFDRTNNRMGFAVVPRTTPSLAEIGTTVTTDMDLSEAMVEQDEEEDEEQETDMDDLDMEA